MYQHFIDKMNLIKNKIDQNHINKFKINQNNIDQYYIDRNKIVQINIINLEMNKIKWMNIKFIKIGRSGLNILISSKISLKWEKSLIKILNLYFIFLSTSKFTS